MWEIFCDNQKQDEQIFANFAITLEQQRGCFVYAAKSLRKFCWFLFRTHASLGLFNADNSEPALLCFKVAIPTKERSRDLLLSNETNERLRSFAYVRTRRIAYEKRSVRRPKVGSEYKNVGSPRNRRSSLPIVNLTAAIGISASDKTWSLSWWVRMIFFPSFVSFSVT